MRCNNSIFKKIFLGTILLLSMTLLLYYGFAFYYEYSRNAKRIVAEAEDLSEKINEAINDYIIQIDGAISSIYYEIYQNEGGALSMLLCDQKLLSDSEKLQQRASLNKFFSQLFLMRRDFVDVYIYVDDEKSYTYSTYGRTTLGYTPLGKKWYHDTLDKNGKTNITMNYIPEQISYKKPVIGISRELKNISNEGITENSVIMLDFTMAGLNNLINTYITNDMTTVILVDKNGDVVSQNGPQLSIDSEFENSWLKDAGKSRIQKMDTGRYIIAKAGKAVYEWNVIIATDTDYIMRQTKGYLIFALCIGLLFFVLAGIVSYLFAKKMSRPILRLERGMQTIQAGDFDISLKKDSDDELGRLIDDFNMMAEHIRVLINEKYEEELQKKEAQYKFLQAQIDPHFIFNTLQIISSMAVIKGASEIETMSNSLARLIRYSIQGDQKTIILEEEINNVRSYLKIQKIRFKDRLSFEIQVEEELNKVKIIKLILQPIVENCLIHGLEKGSGSGKIRVLGYRMDSDICIEIADDGVGMTQKELEMLLEEMNRSSKIVGKEKIAESKEQEAKEKGNHVGLRNINLRLKMYYGDAYGLKIESREKEGTTVLIRIPGEEK